MQRKLWVIAAVVVVLALQACSGGGGGSSVVVPQGSVDVSLTDGPGEYDHVYITVKNIWFHSEAGAGPGMSGWIRFPLAAPVTVDLLSLSNGVVGSPVWKDLKLPAGEYRQIRLVLAPSDPSILHPLTQTAVDNGMSSNNEVVIGATHYPLRVPDARNGIMLNGDFRVNPAGKLKLAIDFDAGHDIVDIDRNGSTEYILKPRLAYFDLDDAGAIIGSLDLASAATNSTSRFVIKAEQVDDSQDPQYHVVRRWTIVNPVNGHFVLYPLRPGTYDIVIRGLDHETVIIKDVPVTKGTTPSAGPTLIPTITMTAGADYPVDGAITFPTGAWINFYQTLPGEGEVPYEIRFRHFNPFIGKFFGFRLSDAAVRVGTYASDVISLTTKTPVEGAGGYRAASGAILYSRASYTANGGIISSATTTVSFGSLSPASPPSVLNGNTVSGAISKPSGTAGESLDRGIVLVAHGGMIVHAQPAVGYSYSVSGLPGGSPGNVLPFAFYGVDALAWSSTTPAKAIAVPAVADLRSGDDTDADMNLLLLP